MSKMKMEAKETKKKLKKYNTGDSSEEENLNRGVLELN